MTAVAVDSPHLACGQPVHKELRVHLQQQSESWGTMQLKQLQEGMRPVASHVQSVFTVQQACTTAEALHGAEAAK